MILYANYISIGRIIGDEIIVIRISCFILHTKEGCIII